MACSASTKYRSRMQSGKTHNKMQAELGWWTVGQTFSADMVAEVVESKAEGFTAGDWIQGIYPLQKYFVAKGDGSDTSHKMGPRKVDKQLPLEKNFTLGSMSGVTALAAIEHASIPDASRYANSSLADCILGAIASMLPCGGFCAPRRNFNFKGKTAVVTAASSSVGTIAGQLLKLKGCSKVIGITSTKDKSEQLLRLGFDAAVAYKEEDLDARLKELASEGIDFDFEMAGGPIFDAVIRNMNKFGKAVVVGNMHDADKDHKDATGIKEVGALVGKSIEVQGFSIGDYSQSLALYFFRMEMMSKSGALKSEETVVHGFDRWGEALERIHSGNKFGQMVVLAGSE